MSAITGVGNQMIRPTAAQMKQHQQEMFAKMDTNGDNSVDKAEFTAFGKQRAEKTGRPDRFEEMFAKIDTNGDGKITQVEMEAQAPPKPPKEASSITSNAQSISDETLAALLKTLENSNDSDKLSTIRSAIQQLAGFYNSSSPKTVDTYA